MAVAEHNVSRREVLAAACAAPVLSAIEGPDALAAPLPHGGWIPDQVRNDELNFVVTNWDRTLAQLRRAEAALAAAAHEPDEEVYGDILVAFNRALKRLLRAPAPDLPALALKLELAARESAWELTGAETCIAAFAREARRFARPPL